MGKNTELNFTIDQLAEFLKKYPIQGLKSYRDIFEDETEVYLFAFKYYVEHGEDILGDYYRIKDTVINLSDEIEIYRDRYLHEGYSDTNIIVKKLKFVINYEGPWNAEKILEEIGWSKERLDEVLNEVQNDFPKYKDKMKIKKKKQQEDYIKKYYEAKRTLTEEDINLFLNCTLKKEISSKINKDIIDVTAIEYPILVFMYKNDKIISIRKVTKNLEISMINYKKTMDFDTYAYIYINENIINDIFAEALIRYNPINMAANAINISNSIYRTLEQIKKRYKDNASVNLRIIKNVINIYHIPIYYLNNGQGIIDKDIFDKELSKYLFGN